MLFNSYEFIFVFLPITLLIFFTFCNYKQVKFAKVTLVVASLAFYAYWDMRYLPLLLLSMMINYLTGKRIAQTRSKKWLFGGVAFNLLLLGYYKYTSFILENVNRLLWTNNTIPEIVLPLGISFFTFTQIAYLVDAYKGETDDYDLLSYSLFVTFFPHLIAGPILHHKDMMPQFRSLKSYAVSYPNIAQGLVIFSLGLFKKVMIADNLAEWVKIVFDNPSRLSFLDAWVGALAYTLQLYFDFSGYSEMAVGLGLILNIKLPINFNSPYKATSIIDFWRRWHITLSVFLRNYLYIPLGGNRKGKVRRYVNLMTTMLLGGLWHGANWTFIVWGGLHGVYLVINHFWRNLNVKLPSFIAWPLTFGSVVFAWVFFRANSVADAIDICRAMLGFNEVILPKKYAVLKPILGQLSVMFKSLPVLPVGNTEIIAIVLLLLGVRLLPNPITIAQGFKPKWQWVFIVVAALSLSLVNLNKASEFLYFQF